MKVRNIIHGTYGGLAGGVVFGAMMGAMGMLPMIGSMVGHPSAVVGFLVHMINSAIIGAGFSLVLGRSVGGVGAGVNKGLLYGGFWWILGPLTLMPLFMGMGLGANWNAGAAVTMMPSLMGHLVFGAILGASYVWLRDRRGAYATASSA